MADSACFDDLGTMLDEAFCLFALSKDVKGGSKAPDSKLHECGDPKCKTRATFQSLAVELTGTTCDDKRAKVLNGDLELELAQQFETSTKKRGFHSGRFLWNFVGGGRASGELSGITNAGTHRAPAFDACQKCGALRVLEGRFCGVVEETDDDQLKDARILCVHKLEFESIGGSGMKGSVVGTLEGVVIRRCR